MKYLFVLITMIATTIVTIKTPAKHPSKMNTKLLDDFSTLIVGLSANGYLHIQCKSSNVTFQI